MLFNIEPQLIALGLMLLALVCICAYNEWRRHKLRQTLSAMSARERAELAESETEVRFSRPLFHGKSYIVTMLIGQLGVNGPLLPIFMAPLILVQRHYDPHDYPLENFLSLLAGFLLAWCWWSLAVSAWRWWAIRHRDMSAEEVQWRGESGKLLWAQSTWFAKTALYTWFDAKRRRPKSQPRG